MYPVYMHTALKLIIFDLDGTLMDSMGVLGGWCLRAMGPYLPRPITMAELVAAYGPTERGIFARFVPAGKVDVCLKSYYEIYSAEHGKIHVFPGINELFAELKRRGAAIALCTGKSRTATMISLTRFGWTGVFSTIITGDDTKRYKPDPEGLKIILGRLHADPATTMFIGDMPTDISAAKGAGVVSGWARWGVPNANPADYKADHVLAAPREVIALLN